MPGDKNPMSQPDLQHRDWVLKSQQALITNIDNTISTKIIDTDDGGKRLVIFNVSESSIQNLLFLTNTDQNNNYLYLEKFNVTIQQDLQPLEFPGLSEIMIKIYEKSDANAFLNGSKTQKPFASSSFNNGQTINQVVDTISSLLPYVTSTYGKVKTYSMVLNPDVLSLGALSAIATATVVTAIVVAI
jgi:hypothetical protein